MGIPIITEYLYLGVLINNKGSLEKHVKKIKNRAKSLASKLKYFIGDLHFENQHLIWSVYVRPYY